MYHTILSYKTIERGSASAAKDLEQSHCHRVMVNKPNQLLLPKIYTGQTWADTI